jgi:hypothetical protein
MPKTIGGNLRLDLMAHKAALRAWMAQHKDAGIPAVLAACAAALDAIEWHL